MFMQGRDTCPRSIRLTNKFVADTPYPVLAIPGDNLVTGTRD